ncbi:glycosyltransferase family 4 protein [Allonocardiopsis opalescens]|uniref:Glycosyltransferase involved in cell wall biosynthesis n=1 Tax=Allonocardiopsis opalescens TaxID=1144618 RepID=A0A2T0QDT7_9ACTN|nr:glycosyltransferase family 4 protein [Allonocardiopsis opalescens]PRY02089.1 glycosyltransferase involved in cell wall biosynthesis [Allonocardiopsis opalescens]
MTHPLRIALLSYRSKPHSGGQGVYVRHLSRELAALGHRVEVFSGQPYPELDPGPLLNRVPSLDLYRDDDPFRTPPLSHWRDGIDAVEVATMWTAGFPEPLTFSLRALRALRHRADLDVVHDNQTLGYGMLGLVRLGFPLVTTIHHPITVDRRIELESATGWQRLGKRRWYGFVRMQGRVARRVGPILVPSRSSADDVSREFGVAPERLSVVPMGVDTRSFRERPEVERVPGRIVTVASADSPLKGVATLLRALAKLATEREVSLIVVGRPNEGGATDRLVDALSLRGRVEFVQGIDDDALARLLASAQVAVVPSLYEGFSLPAVEAMACATPLVASRAGALPEVVGEAAVLVAPGDDAELAAAVGALLDDPEARRRLGRAAWERVQRRYTWRAVAEATAERYREAADRRPAARRRPAPAG